MTAYVTGTSTRKVDDLVRALGVESGISRSTVSRICDRVGGSLSHPADIIEHMFDHVEGIPAGLDRMEPGPALAGFLASIDVDRVSGHDRVVVLRAHQRMASHYQAQVYAAMASVADHMERAEFVDEPELSWDAASTEIRAALRLTRRSADTQLDLSLRLRQRLPRVWQALESGSIDPRRAHVLVHGTSHLDAGTARRVIDSVIDDAQRLTTGQLHGRLRQLAIEADPEDAAQRYRESVANRRLIVEPTTEGTANLLGMDLPPDRVHEVARRINQIALSLNRDGETRSIDELRADVFLDLLAGEHRNTKGGVVDIHVDLETLTELSAAPGDLAGYGPVIADIARQVTEAHVDGEWRFTITDPTTGLPVHDGTTRRRPTAAQRRSVEARDRTCIFPGCRQPSRQCDADHRIPWAEKPHTCTACLDAACRHDHTVRHDLRWSRIPIPGGDHLWTSPLGHQYTTSGRPP